MPRVIVEIEWDVPDEPFWFNADSVSLALHAYCKNTKFKVRKLVDEVVEVRENTLAEQLRRAADAFDGDDG